MDSVADPAASRAVLIGPSRFPNDPDINDLPAVANNLARLTSLLAEERIWGLPETHIEVFGQDRLTGDGAAVRVMAAVSDAIKNTRDLLLIYYAGHGLLDPDGHLHLALPETQYDSLYRALAYEQLRSALSSAVRIPHKILILDCCYAGAASGAAMGSLPPAQTRAKTPRGSFLLGASAPTDTALAVPGEPYTAFTAELITLLDQGVADGESVLRMESVVAHLDEALHAKQRPRPWPVAAGSGGRIVLARNVAYQAPVAKVSNALIDLATAQVRAGSAFPYRLAGAHNARLDAVYVRQDFRRYAPQPGDAEGDERDGDRRPASSALGPAIPLDDVLGGAGHLLVVGPPGQGKTTLTLQLAVRLAERLTGSTSTGDGDTLVGLRVTASALAAEPGPWEQAVARTATRELGLALDRALPEDLLGHAGPRTRWLLMVDGLDEIADPRLRQQFIAQLAQRIGDPALRLLVTTRDLPATELAAFERAGMARYVLAPFDEAQLASFAESWFGADAEGRRLAAGFLAEVKEAGPGELLQVPLLATIAAILYQRQPDAPLPGNTYTLYEQYLGYLGAARAEQTAHQWVDIRRRLEGALSGGSAVADRLQAERGALVEHLAIRAAEGKTDLLRAAVAFMDERGGRQAAIRVPDWPELIAAALDATGLFLHGPSLRFVHLSLAEHLAAAAKARALPERFVEGDPAWSAVLDGGELDDDDAVAVLTHYAYQRGDAEGLLNWLERGTLDTRIAIGALLAGGIPADPVHIERYLANLRYDAGTVQNSRRSAYKAAGRMRHPSAVRYLGEIAEDVRLLLGARVMAAAGLAFAQPARAVAVLNAIIDDPEALAETRAEAIEALTELGPEYLPRVIEAWSSVLTDATADSFDFKEALKSLATYGPEHTRPVVDRMWTIFEDRAAEPADRVRAMTVLARLETRVESVAAAIRAALADAAFAGPQRYGPLLKELANLGAGYALEAVALFQEMFADGTADPSEAIEVAAEIIGDLDVIPGEYAPAAAAIHRAVLADPFAKPTSVCDAASSLIDLGAEYVGEGAAALSAVLDDDSVELDMRMRAAQILGGLGTDYIPQAAAFLEGILTDTRSLRVIDLLVGFGGEWADRALEVLRQIAADSGGEHQQRINAITRLLSRGSSHFADATAALELLASDASVDALDAITVAKEVGRTDPALVDKAVAVLRKRSNGEVGVEVRLEATLGLVKLGVLSTIEGADFLRGVAADPSVQFETRYEAAEELITMGPEYVAEAAATMSRLAREPDSRVDRRADTAKDLLKLGPEFVDDAVGLVRSAIDLATNAIDRRSALRDLAYCGPEYVAEARAALSACAADSSVAPTDRIRWAYGLGRLDDRGAAEAARLLDVMLVDPALGPEQRFAVAQELIEGSMPRDATVVPHLRAIADDRSLDLGLRTDAARELAKCEYGDAAYAESALKAMIVEFDEEPARRNWIARTLINLGRRAVPEAIDALRRTLSDPVAGSLTKYDAAAILAEAGPRFAPEGAALVLEAIVDPGMDVGERRFYVERLADLGPHYATQAAAVLGAAAADRAVVVVRRLEHARVLDALGSEYSSQAADLLRAIIADADADPTCRWVAAEVLVEGRRGLVPEAAEVMREVLADPEVTAFDRRWAAVALARLGPSYRAEAEAAVRAALAAAAGSREDLRWSIAALAKLGAQYAAEAGSLLLPEILDTGAPMPEREQSMDLLDDLNLPRSFYLDTTRRLVSGEDPPERRWGFARGFASHDAEYEQEGADFLRAAAADESLSVPDRIAAASELAKLPARHKEAAVGELLKILDQPGLTIGERAAAAWELAQADEQRTAQAVEMMLTLMADPDTSVADRAEIADLLRDIDADHYAEVADAAEEYIRDHLTTSSDRDRFAHVLARLGPDYAEAADWALTIAVLDPGNDFEARLRAAALLAARGSARVDAAAAELRKVAFDPDENKFHRYSAARVLVALSPAAVADSAQVFRTLATDPTIPIERRVLPALSLSVIADEYDAESEELLRTLAADPECSAQTRLEIEELFSDEEPPARATDDEEQGARPVIA